MHARRQEHGILPLDRCDPAAYFSNPYNQLISSYPNSFSTP